MVMSDEEKKAYYQRPEIKEKRRKYQREYRARPGKIERKRELSMTAKAKEQRKEYYKKPETKKRIYIYSQKPNVIEKRRQSKIKYRKKEVTKIKEKIYKKKYERKHSVRKKMILRDKTKYRFSLTSQKCSCGNAAECRHHTTSPYEFDKFEFMCNKCHTLLHKKLNNLNARYKQ